MRRRSYRPRKGCTWSTRPIEWYGPCTQPSLSCFDNLSFFPKHGKLGQQNLPKLLSNPVLHFQGVNLPVSVSLGAVPPVGAASMALQPSYWLVIPRARSSPRSTGCPPPAEPGNGLKSSRRSRQCDSTNYSSHVQIQKMQNPDQQCGLRASCSKTLLGNNSSFH